MSKHQFFRQNFYNDKRLSRNLYVVLLSTCYAFVVLNIRHYNFMISGDLQSYINYIYSSPIVLLEMYDTGSFFSILTGEPIWLAINAFLGYFLSADSAVDLIVFFSSFTSAYLIIINNKAKRAIIFILLILLLPQILSKYTIHLRQGLAISIFMIWYYSFNRSSRMLIPVLLPFIHSSFFVIMLFIAINKVFNRVSMESYLIFFFAFSTIVSLVFVDVGSFSGARQANSNVNLSVAVSGLNFIYWFAFLSLIIAQGRVYFHRYRLEISFIILYLCGYFVNPYAGRILESTMIIILPILFYLKSKKKIGLVLIISLFLLQYLRLLIR